MIRTALKALYSVATYPFAQIVRNKDIKVLNEKVESLADRADMVGDGLSTLSEDRDFWMERASDLDATLVSEKAKLSETLASEKKAIEQKYIDANNSLQAEIYKQKKTIDVLHADLQVQKTAKNEHLQREAQFWSRAWQRELERPLPIKIHLIDALVSATKDLRKEASVYQSLLQVVSPDEPMQPDQMIARLKYIITMYNLAVKNWGGELSDPYTTEES